MRRVLSLAAILIFLTPVRASAASPPPAGGYFTTLPRGSALPDDATCAGRVHASSWEPRPENAQENSKLVNATRVHASFAKRPTGWSNAWDNTILPRVDGQYTGTTDEIIQWAACKWGLSDEILRGIAVRESTWYSFLHYTNGEPYPDRGSGDLVSTATPASTTYCNGIARFGVDYQQFYGAGRCPKTFGLVGVMSWEDPGWGKMAANQNGTFPFNRNSTAFAVDYLGAHLRGCMEGDIPWLTGPTNDIWGCVGSWYSGDWHSSAADGYISRVQNEIANQTWAQPSFLTGQYQCSKTLGCPV